MNHLRNQVDYMQPLLQQNILSLDLLASNIDSCFTMEVYHVIRIQRSKGYLRISVMQQGVLSPQQMEARDNFYMYINGNESRQMLTCTSSTSRVERRPRNDTGLDHFYYPELSTSSTYCNNGLDSRRYAHLPLDDVKSSRIERRTTSNTGLCSHYYYPKLSTSSTCCYNGLDSQIYAYLPSSIGDS
jgi:hypothetical protein